MHIKEEQLKSILLDSGLVNEASFNAAKEEADRTGQTLPSVLIGREELTEDYLVELLAPYFDCEVVNLRKVAISPEVLTILPETFAKAKNVVLFELNEREQIAKVAMTDPFDLETIDFLRAKLGASIEVYLVTQSSLTYGLRQYKKRLGMKFNEVIEENLKESRALTGEADLSKVAEAVPIITILDSVLENATVMGASDIHFEPLAKRLLIRYRVDGVMQEILTLPKEIATILTARVKILANMQIDEHRVPQDGRFRFDMDEGGRIDIRVNVMPVLNGEKVEMRLLKSSAKPLSLAELGLSDESVAILDEEIKKPHGMILVTGPTGHGKTTTLYSILHILNTSKVNITTIEDPIEYEVSGLNQTQVNTKAGITFANGLRSLMRQNPDIILIGEIRDNETVEISIHAALTGHLVLSSLHTNDAAGAVPRLLDMGAQAFLLASTINVIIAQRLVRKICMSCIESYKPTARNLAIIKEQYKAAGEKIDHLPTSIFRGKGCKVCGGSGFSGQVGVYEILKISEPIRQLISRSASASEIHKQASEDGMKSMFADGMEKVERGLTTIEEIMRVVSE